MVPAGRPSRQLGDVGRPSRSINNLVLFERFKATWQTAVTNTWADPLSLYTYLHRGLPYLKIWKL